MRTLANLSLALALGMTLPCAAHAATFYVAPGGSDAAPGTRDAPFASLERARDALRDLKKAGPLPEGGATVFLRGGAYERSGPFELTAADSGAERSPIVYRGQPGETVRLLGGKAVAGFTPVTDSSVLDRLDEAARGRVLQADLKAQGLADFGQLSERGFDRPVRPAHMELFFRDRPMTLARWPNQGYARIADLPDGQKARRFQYAGDRPRRWLAEPDAWVYGYWVYDWADTYLKVESIDPEKRIIATTAQHGYGLRKDARWCALNVLAELDAPGEYYVDRAKGLLYFWPPEPIGAARAVVSLAADLVVLKDVSHVTLRGLVLEVCRGTAVTIAGGSHCQVVGCTLRNIGNRAVSVSGADHAVIGCDIRDAGDGGIFLAGGDRKTLTPARLLAENNHVRDFSRWSHTYRPAVGVHGCGNIVRHNLLHHGPHNAIQLGGNDHLIEFNEVHSVCADTGDVGAFYMGRDWSARGTVIRHNYWHHIQGPGRIGAMGVYLDDQASGITLFGNVFYQVTRAAFIGGGCDNVVENNVFVDCRPAVHVDARGLGWQKPATDDPEGELRRYLRAMPYQDELWSRRYPELVRILQDDPGTPKRNRIVRNIAVGGQWEHVDAATRKFQTIQDNLVGDDPLFLDRANADFRLRPDSPAFKLGFKPIPIEKIGLYPDDRRASWPVPDAPRAPDPGPEPPNPP